MTGEKRKLINHPTSPQKAAGTQVQKLILCILADSNSDRREDLSSSQIFQPTSSITPHPGLSQQNISKLTDKSL